MGDKGKKAKEKGSKQNIAKKQLQAKRQIERQPRRTP
jgi:hypothetical protein